MARLACGWTAEHLAALAGVSYSGLIHFELSYVNPHNSRVAELVRFVLEKSGIEFIGDDTVRYPKSWNRAVQASMAPYQRELRKIEKLRGRVRRLEAANARHAR
jgi:transcriptional regulator with XRE-family HTH domain